MYEEYLKSLKIIKQEEKCTQLGLWFTEKDNSTHTNTHFKFCLAFSRCKGLCCSIPVQSGCLFCGLSRVLSQKWEGRRKTAVNKKKTTAPIYVMIAKCVCVWYFSRLVVSTQHDKTLFIEWQMVLHTYWHIRFTETREKYSRHCAPPRLLSPPFLYFIPPFSALRAIPRCPLSFFSLLCIAQFCTGWTCEQSHSSVSASLTVTPPPPPRCR